VGRGRVIAALAIGASLLLPAGAAEADRKPTDKERRGIAKSVGVPETCLRIRVSTVPEVRKFATSSYRISAPRKCDFYAADGVIIFKRVNGRWRFVDAGSSFFCSDLYEKVPQIVVEDLGIFCE
jgi:hypothetical protein